MKSAYLSFSGWRQIVDDFDESNTCSQYQIFFLRVKARYLCTFYTLLQKHYNSIDKVDDIASIAVQTVNKADGLLEDNSDNDESHLYIKNYKTLLDWFRHYRNHNDTFVNPSIASSRAFKLHPFLADNPDVVKEINKYCKKNLSHLTIENLHGYLHETIIPDLITTMKKERNDESFDQEKLFSEYNLKTLAPSTVYTWMEKLGFKYQHHRKCYYVDSHESPENVKYRSLFVDRYFQYELRSHRWISIKKEERDKFIKIGQLGEESGYEYEKDDKIYYEYHVDDNQIFHDWCSHLPYGGHLSIRMPYNTKPLMILGQDECIFKQYLFSKGFWTHSDGTKQLIPKEEGQGLMLSCFCSREIGFGYPVPDSVLNEINKQRENEKYIDEKAAMEIYGNAKKKKLTSSPFTNHIKTCTPWLTLYSLAYMYI